MERIFVSANEQVWWADRNGGVCCGRPLKLSGDTDAARDMMRLNEALFRKHGITTLGVSCPIGLRVFREDYDLKGIEVLHHSQYFARLIAEKKLKLTPAGEEIFAYHDPCELGRGCKIYDEPREIIQKIGTLVEPAETRENALCCGSSIANSVAGNGAQTAMAQAVGQEMEATGAQSIVTACPLCKKALARGTKIEVHDLAELVAKHILN
jgi:Fe-S oxidoreductase